MTEIGMLWKHQKMCTLKYVTGEWQSLGAQVSGRGKGMYQEQVRDDHEAESTSQLALEEQAFPLHLMWQRHHRNNLSREVGLEN